MPQETGHLSCNLQSARLGQPGPESMAARHQEKDFCMLAPSHSKWESPRMPWNSEVYAFSHLESASPGQQGPESMAARHQQQRICRRCVLQGRPLWRDTSTRQQPLRYALCASELHVK